MRHGVNNVCALFVISFAASASIGQQLPTTQRLPTRANPFGTPSLARPDKPTPRLDPALEPVPTNVAIQTFHNMARCVVDGNPRGAASIVSMTMVEADALTGELWPGFKRLISRCLGKSGGGQIQGGASLFAGAWAEQLYKRSFAKLPDLSGPLPKPRLAHAEERFVVLKAFSDCLVEKAPANVDQLLRTKVTSEVERASLSSLTPYFPTCLSKGSTLVTNRFTLRLALADSIYGRAQTTSSGNPN